MTAIRKVERCKESLIDASNGDAYDCTRAAGHEGPCVFDCYSARARASDAMKQRARDRARRETK